MFGFLLNGQALRSLKSEVRQYLSLQRATLELTLVVKLTLLLSAVAIAVVLFTIAVLATFYASFALTAWLETLTGSAIVANALMAGVFAAIALVAYLLREPLIERPIATLLTRIFYNNDHGEQSALSDTPRTPQS